LSPPTTTNKLRHERRWQTVFGMILTSCQTRRCSPVVFNTCLVDASNNGFSCIGLRHDSPEKEAIEKAWKRGEEDAALEIVWLEFNALASSLRNTCIIITKLALLSLNTTSTRAFSSRCEDRTIAHSVAGKQSPQPLESGLRVLGEDNVLPGTKHATAEHHL